MIQASLANLLAVCTEHSAENKVEESLTQRVTLYQSKTETTLTVAIATISEIRRENFNAAG